MVGYQPQDLTATTAIHLGYTLLTLLFSETSVHCPVIVFIQKERKNNCFIQLNRIHSAYETMASYHLFLSSELFASTPPSLRF